MAQRDNQPDLFVITAKQYDHDELKHCSFTARQDQDLCAITTRQDNHDKPELCAFTARQYEHKHNDPDLCETHPGFIQG